MPPFGNYQSGSNRNRLDQYERDPRFANGASHNYEFEFLNEKVRDEKKFQNFAW